MTNSNDALRAALKDMARDVFIDAATQVHYSWIDGTNASQPDFDEAAGDYAESFADAYVDNITGALTPSPVAGDVLAALNQPAAPVEAGERDEARIRHDERKKINAQGCIHTRKAGARADYDRPDVSAWQADQQEWFDPTICEIVSEYAAWRDTRPPDPAASTVAQGDNDEGKYLILKYGRYYRPNAEGYTNVRSEAGLFTLDKAISHSHPNGPDGPRDGISYSPATHHKGSSDA